MKVVLLYFDIMFKALTHFMYVSINLLISRYAQAKKHRTEKLGCVALP